MLRALLRNLFVQATVLLLAGPAVAFGQAGGAQTGTVTGQVTDAVTGEPVVAADVWLDGTSWRIITTAEGRFLLAGVNSGTYNLRVRRIGYAPASQVITVQAGQSVTANFSLQSAPTQLDAIVATVTGEQRIREMGHVVGRISADSLVREAPITSLSELLTARVPGLQVFQTSGTVGGEVSLRVRSANSVNLSNDPIVIVDGVRYTSGTGFTNASNDKASPFDVEPTSRLNDINPNDIESIEIVKGPSATTLYGTDAANGVIVITTKRGRSGPAQWNAYARAGITEIPTIKYPDSYWGWGTATVNCTLRGTCTQDSVTVVPNPLNDPKLTIIGSKPNWQYGANVAGGGKELRYYISADFEEAVGPLRIPPLMAEAYEEVAGRKLLKSQLEPNGLEKINLRANVSTELSEKTRIRVNLGYTQSETRQISLTNPFNNASGTVRPNDGPYGPYNIVEQFARTSTESINRFTASAAAEYQPMGWLHTRATVGLDLPNSQRYSLQSRDELTGTTGTVGEDRSRTLVTTGDLGATASFRRDNLTSRTSVGAQYVRNYSNRLSNTGTNLRPGGSSIIDAASITARQFYNETVTLGSYVEQVVGYNDRLFLTAALRADGASTFGNDYKAAFYPKAGLSWVVSEEPFIPSIPGLDELRLRYAFGASGQQPNPDMRRLTFSTIQRVMDGVAGNAVDIVHFPSPDLRPEKVREHEIGLDASTLAGRVRLDLTWNSRRTVDQIQSVPVPAGFGNLGVLWKNLGLVTGHGFEAQLSAILVDAPNLSWDLSLSHATNNNKLEDIGTVVPSYSFLGSLVEGYPLGARFMRPLLSYEDVNGDGILQTSEVQLGDTAVYVGRGTPGNMQTLRSGIALFGHRVRVSALFERKGDFMQMNGLEARHETRARGAVDPTAPLSEQARVIAKSLDGPIGQRLAPYTYLEKGDFVRLREVSVALDLPTAWVSKAHLRRATLNLSGRNLALWTDFSGPDPESARVSGFSGGQADFIPHARNWIVRMDIGF